MKRAILLTGLLLASSQAARAVNCGGTLGSKYNAKTAQTANAKFNCLGKEIDATNASNATNANDIATLKNDVTALKNSGGSGGGSASLAADVAALKNSVNTLNAAVAALQGQPPTIPPSVIFEDSFLKGQVTGASRNVSNHINSQSSSTTVSASFTVTNKTQQVLLLLAYYYSPKIIDDKAGGSCSDNPNVPYTSSSKGPLDPKDYLRLEPGASIAVSLSCNISHDFVINDPTTLSFSIDFYTYSANGPGLLSVSFGGVAAN